jgi:hypothetical protein
MGAKIDIYAVETAAGSHWAWTYQAEGYAPFQPDRRQHATRAAAETWAGLYVAHETALSVARAANEGAGLSRAAYEAGCKAAGVEPTSDEKMGYCERYYAGTFGDCCEPAAVTRHTAMTLAVMRTTRLEAEARAKPAAPLIEQDERRCKRCRQWQPADRFTTIGVVCDDCA